MHHKPEAAGLENTSCEMVSRGWMVLPLGLSFVYAVVAGKNLSRIQSVHFPTFAGLV